MIETLVIGCLIALVLTAVIYFLTGLILDQVGLPSGGNRIAWLIAVLLILLVWWKFVIGPLLGPLP